MFFEADRGRLCTIQRRAGQALLPSACRHFPRIALRDPRGSFVTLSGFCPTVARLLQQNVPLRIVHAPPGIALLHPLEGLDATGVLPPLLGSGVLMDYDGYSAWEHAAIAVLDRDDLDVLDALELIAGATERVRQWRPGDVPLARHVADVFGATIPAAGEFTELHARPLRMFAAAHLFGSWAAYQDGGIHGVVEAVHRAVLLVQGALSSGASFVEAVRAADLELRHTEDPDVCAPTLPSLRHGRHAV